MKKYFIPLLISSVMVLVSIFSPLKAQTSTPGLVAAYSFDEGIGLNANDSSGNGHTGVLSGAIWTSAGKFGNALAFNGTSSWVTVNTTSLLNLTTSMTLEAWVFPTATTGVRDIVLKEGSNVDIYNLYARNWRGLPEANVLVGGANRVAEGTTLPANGWTHIAGTYDGSMVQLFVNGVQVSSTAIAGTISTSTGPLRIGGNGLWGEYFQGSIDEVRIYNRPLTQTEIQTDMNTPIDSAPIGAPTVTITAPADGATIAGTVNVTANASDDIGVVGVQFLLDGVNLGAEVTSAPYLVVWDTITIPIGSHTLAARARDGAGNITTSQGISVTVANNPVPGNFYDEVVIGSGLTFPTAFEFLPDGRMLITEFRGRVLVVQSGASSVDAISVMELPNIFNEDVTVGGERGLVNVVADPDFANNGYIYLFYTAATPQRDRVSRFTMLGNTADPTSEFVVWQGAANSTSTDHHGGGLAFGPDEKLYISTGDNGDPPSSQPLTSDHGKILRMNKDGTIPTDNPFFDGSGPNIDAIWVRGLRNPYRFSFDSANGRMYIGDVGQNSFEEVNIGAIGANYGWPTCEGPCSTAGMTNPLFSYSHNGRDAAVTGGFVYRGNQFPASYQGVYFYGDFAQNWIRYLTLNGSGNVTGSTNFLPPDGSLDGPYDPVMLKQGPDGSLYYVDFGWGWQGSVNPASIRRIRYISGNQPPVAVASATPLNGQAPLSVSFSSAGSFDPENQPLSYAWTFEDGSTLTTPNPVHVYAQSGLYNARLSVSDGATTTLSGVLTIAVGNPPQGNIISPASGLVFLAGDVITFSGTATDPEDGPLPPTAYSWTILFHHDSHVHPTLGPVSGMTGGFFTIPNSGHDFSGNTNYEIILTVIDSSGLQSTSSVSVYPHKVNLAFVTNPASLAISLDGISHATPYVKDTLSGFHHTVDAPNQTQDSVDYTFGSWSDAGAQTHDVTVGAVDATYTATYQAVDTTAPVRSNGVPTGVLPAGTTQATLSLVTDENATCRYATTAGMTYGAMTNTMATIGGAAHSTTVSGLSNGGSYNYFVRCQDGVGNTNTTDFPISFSVATPPTVTAFPSSATLLTGTLNTGTAAALVSDNNVYFAVNSTTTGTRTSAWYGSFTGVSSGLTNLLVNYKGKNSRNCTQTVAIWRWTTSAWVQLDSRTVGTTEVPINNLGPTGMLAEYVSGNGEMRVRVQCQATANLINRGDLMSIIYNAPVGPPPPPGNGTLLAYGFNEESGTTSADLSGNNSPATLVGGVTWTSAAVSGNAVALNGSTGYVSVANAGLSGGSFTASAWVFLTRNNMFQTVIEALEPSSNGWELDLESGGRLSLWSNNTLRFTTAAAVPLNTWTYLTLRRSGATWEVFINGSKQPETGTDATTFTFGACPFSVGVDADIGCTSGLNGFLQGRVDEVRVYNRALTDAEIQTDMNAPVN